MNLFNSVSSTVESLNHLCGLSVHCRSINTICYMQPTTSQQLIYWSRMKFLGALPMMVSFVELIHGCIQFDFSREVSFFATAQVIGTYPGSSREELFGVCASRCTKDIRCNAIDICSENLKCRLIRGWTPLTPGNVSEGVCQRFQMVKQ